ncbi:unnamed protein product [Candidula unifasciata]|uniref:G-protein coupled receptors family 1 profile domain-containing protein n=1 Tax=Candidula unifasciata TaxID=100452 RepID=A0A8S4A1L4_9EUPU|nr:unnamed protein product [Candidula unifasciata]
MVVVQGKKIQKIITVKRTTSILAFIYILTLLSWVPLYSSSYLDWKFFPDRNQTLIGLIFINKEQLFTAVCFINAFFGVLSLLVIVIFTTILICQLKAKSEWRKSANVQKDKAESMSNRDKSTVVMVVLISVILIICYTPSIIISLVTYCYTEFSVEGTYFFLYQIVWSGAFVLENLNSSVNILLYLKMSSKYKAIFKNLFFL